MRELKQLNEEKLIFIDIETAPVVKELQVGTPLFDAWAYKVAKDGVTDNDEVIKSFSEKAGLYPEFARIVCVVVGVVVKDKFYLKSYDDKDEVKLLENFNNFITKQTDKSKDYMLCGFANYSFDTPFCHKRMYINGIEPNEIFSGWDRKPWIFDEVDLKNIWKGTSWNNPSLISLATSLGIKSPKDDISGADVGKVYWSEGDEGLSRISKYCLKDVETVYHIFKKLRFETPSETVVAEDKIKVEVEESPILIHLFNGGRYGSEEKDKLISLLDTLNNEELSKAFVLLTAISSTAKGKKTKITKAHIKTLIKSYE